MLIPRRSNDEKDTIVEIRAGVVAAMKAAIFASSKCMGALLRLVVGRQRSCQLSFGAGNLNCEFKVTGDRSLFSYEV